MAPKKLIARPLPAFDPGRGLDAVQSAFARASTVKMAQAWRKTPEPDFTPTPVRVGAREGKLWVLGEMVDADVFNDATAHNQNTWEMGDVFEIFLQREGQRSYIELHVTPENIRLYLRLPGKETIQRLRGGQETSHAPYYGDPASFSSWAWKTEKGWAALAAVSIEPGTWRYSFCRYDAHRDGRSPTISSTSPHAVANFHALDDWQLLGI